MKKREPEPERDDAMDRMNKALKKMLETPPETHEEMVRRRQKRAKKLPSKSR